MKQTYRHIGYYNDFKDATYLYDLSADDVIRYMLLKMGNFCSVTGESDTDIDNYKLESDSKQFKLTTNKEYLVRYESGSKDGDGWFIDIYQLTEVEDDSVYEYCPHCDCEVPMVNEFKVQVCPNCGKYIVVCNLCPLLSDGKCPTLCPLEILAKELNKED